VVRFPWSKDKGKRFFVRLTGRGGISYILGEVKAKDMNELMDFIIKKLEEMGDVSRKYAFIRITDLERNQEIKVENPLYEGDLALGERTKSEDSLKTILDKTAVEAYINTITTASRLGGTIISSMAQGIAEGMKEMLKSFMALNPNAIQQQQQQQPTIKDFATIASFLMDLVRNREKYEQLVKEAMKS